MRLQKLILPRWGALGHEARDTARPPEKRRAHLVRLIRWSSVFVAVTLFAVWVLIYSKWNLRDNPVASSVAIGYLLFICAGPFWMVYDCWHHDKKFTPKLWLFFVPGGFLWYYFESFRPRFIFFADDGNSILSVSAIHSLRRYPTVVSSKSC